MIFYENWKLIMAQIIRSTRRAVEFLLDVH